MKLLQHTLGACRVEHICQAVPSDLLYEALLQPCTNELKECARSVLGFSSITEAQWIELTLPTRMGGLGIRDPQGLQLLIGLGIGQRLHLIWLTCA